jgi:hypothetical protein
MARTRKTQPDLLAPHLQSAPQAAVRNYLKGCLAAVLAAPASVEVQ